MAVNTRSEAEAVARRLGTKGYPAFVTTTGAGTRVSYRVRVGKYDTQREAEAISARLQKEEQFKPWVTR
jgi:cell division protein FtsN